MPPAIRLAPKALFEESVPSFWQAGDRLRLALAVAVVGYLVATQHHGARASDLLDESQNLLRQLESDPLDPRDRVLQLLTSAYVYNFLGQIRMNQGDHQAVSDLISLGLATARHAPDRFTTLISLFNLAASSCAQGDRGGAAKPLSEGLSLAAEAGDETTAAYDLHGLAVMASPEDDPRRAVHLLAAAAVLLEAKGSGWLHALLPPEASYDDALAALRARLGDAAYETAWAFGRSMASERAVECALAGQPGGTSGPGQPKAG